MSIDWLMLLILLLAILVGFVLGRGSKKEASAERAQLFDQRCIGGLNQLLLERSDDAVMMLVESLEVTPETFETHLALGALLRRQGEVAQAISVHQRLLAVSGVDAPRRQSVQLELALNYVSAGLLDRAELILLELEGVVVAGLRERCLKVLVELYQSEGEWRQAISVLARMDSKELFGVGLGQLKAHYCCELAVISREKRDWRSFLALVSEAAGYDKLGLRHNWLRLEFDMLQGNFSVAVKSIKKLVAADATVLPLLGGGLVECYVGLGRPAKLKRYLRQQLDSDVYAGHGSAFVLALARDIAVSGGGAESREFLLSELRRRGGLSVLSEVLASESVDWDGRLESVAVVGGVLASLPSYRCGSCGFSGRKLHWLCPSCKKWSTFTWNESLSLGRGSDLPVIR